MSIMFGTDHFSGPGSAIGPLYVCLCVHITITLERNNLSPRFSLLRFTLTQSS